MKLGNTYFLFRHGEAKSNQQNFVSCWPEKVYNPLTEKGLRKIKKVAVKLKKEKIDLIFASDLLRARQSAEIIAQTLGLKINFDRRLREIDMGIFNGGPEEEWNGFFKTNLRRFTSRPPGGENYRDIKKRVKEFIKEIDKKYENKIFLIIGHGCVLFSLQAATKNLTEKEEMRHRKDLILKTGEFRQLVTGNK